MKIINKMPNQQQNILHTIAITIGYVAIGIVAFGIGSWLISVIAIHGVAYPICWINIKLNSLVVPLFELILPKKFGGILGILISWALTITIIILPFIAMQIFLDRRKSSKKKIKSSSETQNIE